MCRQCKIPLGQHSVLGLLHPCHSQLLKSLILTQDLASMSCAVQLHTRFIEQVSIPGDNGRKLQVNFVPVTSNIRSEACFCIYS